MQNRSTPSAADLAQQALKSAPAVPRSVHELFEAQAARTPDAPAVVLGDHCLTYGELDARANQVAHYLRRHGVKPDALVALCLERSLDMPVAILGVLKAGGAYVPLDPTYPDERIAFMIADAAPRLLLTQRKFAPRFAGALKPICLDSDRHTFDGESPLPGDVEIAPEQLAYVIYTSGSSGSPKGVLVHHAGVVNHNLAVANLFGLTAADRISQCTSLSFDIIPEELFPTWSRGGTVVLHPPGVVGAGDEFTEWITRQRITVVDLPTAFWHEWVAFLWQRQQPPPPSVRLAVVGGQKASARALATWNALCGDAVDWINGYGPTEASIAVTFFSQERGDRWNAERDIPIGRPIPGITAYIVSPQGTLCRDGEAGELCLAGVGLARGYLGRPELTAERFVPNPFSSVPGDRLYRTGDVVHRHSDGVLEFRGRIDDQVKIRGFRIEPGEIEAVIRRHPLAHDAVVMARSDSDHADARLIAYVVLARPGVWNARDLNQFLRQALPDYMVPSDYVAMDALPLTPNGKVDKARLPLPAKGRDLVGTPYVAPATETARQMAEIWSGVLGVAPVGLHDNFFELGGHSLRAAQVVARIRDRFGAEIPLATLFARPTLAELAAMLATQEGGRAAPTRTIPTAARDERVPLSFSQERVWFLQRLSPDSRAYHFQTLLRFTGPLNVAALRDSLTAIVARHEIFRTTFPERDGVPYQRIHAPFAVDLPIIDLRGHAHATREAENCTRNQMARSFDLAQLPLVRWTLLRMADDQFDLLHIEHHLVHDGWSFNVFRRELLQLYVAFSQGHRDNVLPPQPIDFADFAVWERGRVNTTEFQEQLQYWTRQLRDVAPLDLPMCRPRPPVQRFEGALYSIEIAPELYGELRALSEAHGVTLFMTLLSGFFVLLHRYSGQDDITVGSGVANRRWSETEGLIGMLVNNIVLRSTVTDAPTVKALLHRVRTTTLDGFSHQDVPFDHVVQALGQKAVAGRNPLFQAMFSFHDSPLDEPVIPGIDFTCIESLGNGSAKFDLNVVAVPHAEQRAKGSAGPGGNGISILWEYDKALFDGADVEHLAEHYRTLLAAMVAYPDRSIFALPLANATDIARATTSWHTSGPARDTQATIHDLFARQVAAAPDAVALTSGTTSLTYRALNDRANRLARRLIAQSLAPEALVIVALDRSMEMVVALLATLKAGAAYVPLDLSAPDERLSFMVGDTGARIVITDRAHAGRCKAWTLTAVLVDDDGGAGSHDATDVAVPATADSLAYVMYTSGSTGRPKGVAVTHRGVVRLVSGLHHVHLDASERLLQMAPASFDASTFEIWGALLNGARCAIFPPGLPSAADLGRCLREQAVTTLWLTSSLFNAIVDEHPSVLAPVRQLLVGGDALSVAHIRRAQEALPQTTIINGYGPTEATTFTCCHRLESRLAGDARSVPIGRPLSNTEVYLLDEWMAPVPAGAPGELYVGGDGLARGYLNQPALTAERFVPNPFGIPGSRLYRTGDWARHLPDGAIEFLGRRDGQVKLRGFRIELGEIEEAIRRQPSVRDAAVVVHEEPAGDKRLAAYVVVEDRAAFPLLGLRDALRATLPDYMVPAWLMTVAALPLTANGKLDRKALPPPDTLATEREPEEIARPENEIETAITAIWCEVLGLTTAGVHDNFFDAGGHSLLATKLVGRIRSDLGVAVPLRTVFEQPTIAGLAHAVAAQSSKDMRDRRSASPWTYLFDLSPGRGTEPVFFLPGGTGGDYEFLVYARLVHHVADRFKFFGLRAISADGTHVSQASVEAMAADYIGEMLKVHPTGPFRLVGNCIGGVVAFEVAQQLRRQGHNVSTLVLMDTDYPSQRRYARYRWRRLGDYIAGRMEILSYYRRRLSHHRSELKARRWLEKFGYVAGRTKTVVRDSVELQDGMDLAETYKQSYQQTLRRYRPVPYDGAAKFIVSEERHRHDPIGAWAQTVRGPITILQAPGDHDAYIRDHVRVVAEQLRLCLQDESEQRL